AKVKANSWSGNVGRMGLVARFKDNTNYYYVYYDDHAGQLVLRKTVEGTETILSYVSLSLSTGIQHLFKLEANGNTIKVYVNGQLKLNVTDSTLPKGKVGVYTHFAQAYFDDVYVRAIP
ncbi:hypothetical protein AB4Z22_41325, partial [Paenibacillus sp. TAF58]